MRVLSATCLAVVFSVGLGAQQAQTGQAADDQKKSKAPAAAAADDKSVTVTGCLRAGTTANSFVLANVAEPSPAPAPDPAATAAPPATPPATPPTPPDNPPANPPAAPPANPPAANPPAAPPAAGTPPAAPAAAPAAAVGTSGAASADIRLIGAPANLDLSKHVGHTVKITGMWTPQGKGSGAAAAARSFNVKSMEHVSDTCK